MPELPEVETTARALRGPLEGQRIRRIVVRERRLRWPVDPRLPDLLAGACVTRVRRRAKYVLVETAAGTLLIHLGMSGSIRLLNRDEPPGKHEHVDIVCESGEILRYKDPRRFGAFVWVTGDPAAHPLLKNLGPEPWDQACDADYLFALSRGRRVAVKSFIMDAGVIVGVGNIYANEALFRAGIRPRRAAGRVSRAEYGVLLAAIRQVLEEAIRAGGTTLRDFAAGRGQSGYFQVQLAVYGRGGQPCPGCGARLAEVRTGGRSTVYCPHCQK